MTHYTSLPDNACEQHATDYGTCQLPTGHKGPHFDRDRMHQWFDRSDDYGPGSYASVTPGDDAWLGRCLVCGSTNPYDFDCCSNTNLGSNRIINALAMDLLYKNPIIQQTIQIAAESIDHLYADNHFADNVVQSDRVDHLKKLIDMSWQSALIDRIDNFSYDPYDQRDEHMQQITETCQIIRERIAQTNDLEPGV